MMRSAVSISIFIQPVLSTMPARPTAGGTAVMATCCTTDHETPVAVDTNFSGKYVQITVNNSLACGLGDNQKI